MKHRASYSRVYFILIVILSGVQVIAFGQDSLPYPVILSSRWFHPTSPQDTLSTLKMVDLYHPDRIDWMYCTNAEQLAQLKHRGIPYSLAINPQVPDSLEYTAKGRIVDLNGKKLVAPWMQNWKQKNANWGCVNSPEFKKVFYAQSSKLIDLGAYGLFVDDARFNDHAVEWGGCFCDYCMAGFEKCLQSMKVDSLNATVSYKDYLHKYGITTVSNQSQKIPLWGQFKRFQTQSVIQFLKTWRAGMEAYAKRPIVFLTNNFGGRWSEIYQVFDVGIAELPEDNVNAEFIQKQVAVAKNLGKQQYFTLPSDDSQKQIKALLLAYAVGSGLVIPWDVMVAKKSTSRPERYFGITTTYTPIYSLFQTRRLAVKNKYSSSRARASNDISFKVESDNYGDEIKVEQFANTDHQVIGITNQDNGLVHKITVTPNNVISISTVKVLFFFFFKILIRDNKLKIEYEGDAIILNVQL